VSATSAFLLDGAAARSRLQAEAYPPPSQTARPSATPDDAGYLEAPAFIPFTLVRWSDLPADSLLRDLGSELEERSSHAMAGRVTERFGLGLTSSDFRDTEAGLGLRMEGAEALLDAMFAADASPRIQGYFEVPPLDGPHCLTVLSHPWPIDIPHPPSPLPQPEDHLGASLPSTIQADAAAFRFCADALGEWLWMDWAYGLYEALLAQEWPGAASPAETYHLLRP
jgi:hypothetical protein